MPQDETRGEAAPDDRLGSAEPGQDFRRLPPSVRLDETIASVGGNPVPDRQAGRHLDQHRALRDD